MTRDELQHHMFATYTTLRIGLAVIAFAFPILLWLGGRVIGLPLQDSMSAYYHAFAADGQSMRNWFVGILFAVGVILYLYQGYSYRENYARMMESCQAFLDFERLDSHPMSEYRF